MTRRALLGAPALLPLVAAARDKEYFVYVGGYTNGPKQGLMVCKFNPDSGTATPLELAAESRNPSFFSIHPNSRFLYAANEIGNFNGERAGCVSAFARDSYSGHLTMLNQVTSRGIGPCYVSVNRGGQIAMTANYVGGSVASYRVNGDSTLTGPISFYQHSGNGPNQKRQEGPHAHSINPDQDSHFAVATDLGADQVLVYKLDPGTGAMTPNDPPYTKVAPGSGPRHFVFHPSQKYGYVANELVSTVTGFRWDKQKGTLTEIETVPVLPEGWKGSNTTAEIQVHPNGKFLYISNRGHDSISVFRIDGRTGKLKLIVATPSGGKTPRNFGIDPRGKWLIAANQDSNNVVVFKIDPSQGTLTPTGSPWNTPTPTCVRFCDPIEP